MQPQFHKDGENASRHHKCSSKTHTKPEMSFLLRFFLKLTSKIPPHHVTALGPTFFPGFHPGKEVKEISSAEIFIAFAVRGSICNLFKVQNITSNLAD